MPGRGVRRGELPSSSARSPSSGGSTRARKQLLDRVIWALRAAGACIHPLPPLQLDRAAARLDLRPPRRAAPGWSRSSSSTCIAASRSSSWTAARSAAASPTWTTGSTALMKILANEDGCATAGSSTSGTRRTTTRSGSSPRCSGSCSRSTPEPREEGPPHRRGRLEAVLRRGVPGHPDADPLHPAREGDPRVGAEGADEDGAEKNPRRLPRRGGRLPLRQMMGLSSQAFLQRRETLL